MIGLIGLDWTNERRHLFQRVYPCIFIGSPDAAWAQSWPVSSLAAKIPFLGFGYFEKLHKVFDDKIDNESYSMSHINYNPPHVNT